MRDAQNPTNEIEFDMDESEKRLTFSLEHKL